MQVATFGISSTAPPLGFILTSRMRAGVSVNGVSELGLASGTDRINRERRTGGALYTPARVIVTIVS